MLFSTDQQTLDDLNIFGRHGSQSVYGIFNHTHTRGGAALLEEMFRYPLSDAHNINQRSNTIRLLAGTTLRFPFSASLFDAIDTYLANRDERTLLDATQVSLGAKLGRLLAKDGDTQMIISGIQALATLWAQLYSFLQQDWPTEKERREEETNESERDDLKERMMQLLHHPSFEALLHEKKLNTEELATYDALFRFKHIDLTKQLLREVYQLDVYLSVAKVCREKQFCFPKAIQSEQPASTPSIIIKGVYHPHVPNAVANDVSMLPGSNLILLTGANMAGKSTFMKSLSIALFLAHMGFPVPAKQMDFTPLDGIYTTINLPDNLGMGASHFYAEVLRVKKMAQELASGRRLFILFDELFRGTNVKDAYDATITITSAFAGKSTCLFVLSTHIVEAGPILSKHENIRFLYLPTTMNGQQPVYTYKLSQGITDDRHGMVIIRNEGILDILEKKTNNGIYSR
jgi:DNA mismatch repair protein MutS